MQIDLYGEEVYVIVEGDTGHLIDKRNRTIGFRTGRGIRMSKFVRAGEHKAPEAQVGAFTSSKRAQFEATIYAVDNIECSRRKATRARTRAGISSTVFQTGKNGANRRVFSRYYIGDVVFPSGSDNFSLFDLGDAVTRRQVPRAAYNDGEAELPDRGDLLGRRLRFVWSSSLTQWVRTAARSSLFAHLAGPSSRRRRPQHPPVRTR